MLSLLQGAPQKQQCLPIPMEPLFYHPHGSENLGISLAFAFVMEKAINSPSIAKVSPWYCPSPYCTLNTGIATFCCHTNRSVKLPSFRHKTDSESAIPDYQQGEVGGKTRAFVSQGLCFDVSQAVRIARFESVSESQPNCAIQCH